MNDSTTRPRSLRCAYGVVTLAVALAIAAAIPAAGRGARFEHDRRSTPECLRAAQRVSACRLVVGFFDAIEAGRYRKACALLGRRLRRETGGRFCPSRLASAAGTPFTIVGARDVATGVLVLLRVGFYEFDHYRMLGWAALVGREAGGLRILRTQRV